jgi:hypothetical protein
MLHALKEGWMKQLTTTKATYRDIPITVSSDKFDSKTMFCCSSSVRTPATEPKWFETQGEALANERREIDQKMGFAPRPEAIKRRWSR